MSRKVRMPGLLGQIYTTRPHLPSLHFRVFELEINKAFVLNDTDGEWWAWFSSSFRNAGWLISDGHDVLSMSSICVLFLCSYPSLPYQM